MASIDKTAYPRFKRTVSERELREAYSPSLVEMDWAREMTDSDENRLSLVVWLKCCQRLGRFPRLAEIPAQVITYIRDERGLPERLGMAGVAERTGRNHKALVRDRLGLDGDQASARKLAEQAVRLAAKTKDHPADLINVALEELAKNSCEFPAFSTLDDLASQVRAEVNTAIFTLAYGRMGFDDHARMLGMLEVDPATGRSGHDRAKKSAPRATVTKLRQQLDHLVWLDGSAGASDAWLKGVPAAKIAHFAAEARALGASEMRDYGEVKRIVLEACLLHQARVRARDDLVTMLCKRMNTMHTKARELLDTIRAEQRQRNERMLAVLGDLLSAAKDVDVMARTASTPWTVVRRRHETGRAVLETIETNGGLVDLMAEHEALAAYHGDNYLPLLDRFYRSHRALLLRLAGVLLLEPATTDRKLLAALEFVRAHATRTSELIGDEYVAEQEVVDEMTGEISTVKVRKKVDVSFAPEAWQKVVTDRRRPGKLVRRHFEICVFSWLADELVRGDVAAVGSEAYANWQSQLLSWEACQPHLAEYCAEVGLPDTAAGFVAQLKTRMKQVAAAVDAGYPDNTDLAIDEQGRPTLKARKSAGHSPGALELVTTVKGRLPERSLLEILSRTTRHLRWFRHFGPLSGSDAKLADPLERYLLVAFAYGCNLGAAQAARHLGGHISAHELSYTVRKHVTVASLNKAIADVVNAYLRLDLPRLWGEGNAVAADGTKYDIYVDNLIAEYHIRYGGYGGIAYHHIADNYIALFSRFVPCGVWEAVYIIEGLLEQERGGAQGDPCRYARPELPGLRFSASVRVRAAAAYPQLPGPDLPPARARGALSAHRRAVRRPDQLAADLAGPDEGRDLDPEGELSSTTLLRRLRHDSKRNKMYRTFRELGRVIRTMVLLRYVSDASLRENISRATNMVESYNNFAKWIGFGNNGVIAENDPEEQEKAIKFNTLVADLVMYQTTLDMSLVLNQLRSEGQAVHRADVAIMSPYQEDNVRRFGDYIYDLNAPLDDMDVHLDLGEETGAV
ncbi:DUF4158 domain-containing protein [Nonomuraea deserti]|uniref:DUF4158 domain-containing protein n=1 Tax=Nonomuraea deserti TaxID=1848322 RepID=A0A4R4UVR0_9ACTN|nr:Tn3 family transposase [Nonomuraea deserti]TDC90959.1 DUF4158 domain-containing protein [Nonomuraea deserti]